MDDDDLRRGRPTLHVAFDEATAILVGDGLQSLAFESIARDVALTAQQRVELIARLARAAGFAGMVGGQSLDMAATQQQLSLDELKRMHAMKTGALINAALCMGGIIGAASDTQLQTLERVGERIGLAFQIVDDVLDVLGDTATLGKTRGKDAAAGKATYVTLLGLDKARGESARLYEEALDLLQGWSSDADELRALLGKMVKRDH
ncbi:MAG: geranylgeranyl pyrophosphate synthase [Halieaceae bacterium]|jgi:geranylgeranyl pyrophosphate synthase